jgi:hypothetical protein
MYSEKWMQDTRPHNTEQSEPANRKANNLSHLLAGETVRINYAGQLLPAGNSSIRPYTADVSAGGGMFLEPPVMHTGIRREPEGKTSHATPSNVYYYLYVRWVCTVCCLGVVLYY